MPTKVKRGPRQVRYFKGGPLDGKRSTLDMNSKGTLLITMKGETGRYKASDKVAGNTFDWEPYEPTESSAVGSSPTPAKGKPVPRTRTRAR